MERLGARSLSDGSSDMESSRPVLSPSSLRRQHERRAGQGSITVSIVSVKLVTDSVTGKSFTNYEVVVKSHFGDWVIERRFRQFDELHSQLCLLFPSQTPQELFPSKKRLFRNTDEQFVENRRQKLEWYMRQVLLLHPICSSDTILDFLEIRYNAIKRFQRFANDQRLVMLCERLLSFTQTPSGMALYMKNETIRNFVSEEEAHCAFLALVVKKIPQILTTASSIDTEHAHISNETKIFCQSLINLLHYHQLVLEELRKRTSGLWPAKDALIGSMLLELDPLCFSYFEYVESTKTIKSSHLFERLCDLLVEQNTLSDFGMQSVEQLLVHPIKHLEIVVWFVLQLSDQTYVGHVDYASLLNIRAKMKNLLETITSEQGSPFYERLRDCYSTAFPLFQRTHSLICAEISTLENQVEEIDEFEREVDDLDEFVDL